jgi:hypothetical protein
MSPSVARRDSPKIPSIYRQESIRGNHPGSLSFCKPVNLRPGADLNHLWQRFLLASSLIVGLFIGVVATVFGYSNLATVDVHWSIVHIDGVPLWTVALVPLALFVIAGTLYHWMDGLHHFTEHMRHRRRVHELEAEVASLRAHLDQVLEMPDQSTSKLPARKGANTASLPAADEGIADLGPATIESLPAPAQETHAQAGSSADANRRGDETSTRRSRSAKRRRITLEMAADAHPPDRSGSHVEGVSGDGKAAEPGDSLEPEP